METKAPKVKLGKGFKPRQEQATVKLSDAWTFEVHAYAPSMDHRGLRAAIDAKAESSWMSIHIERPATLPDTHTLSVVTFITLASKSAPVHYCYVYDVPTHIEHSFNDWHTSEFDKQYGIPRFVDSVAKRYCLKCVSCDQKAAQFSSLVTALEGDQGTAFWVCVVGGNCERRDCQIACLERTDAIRTERHIITACQDVKMIGSCTNCKERVPKQQLKWCPCTTAQYCKRECQLADYERHKPLCKKAIKKAAKKRAKRLRQKHRAALIAAETVD